MALGFEEASEQPHFHKNSFRVRKKIFATLDTKAGTAVLKLTPHDQSVFTDLAPDAIRPVKGSWGEKGWTEIELQQIEKDLLHTAMKTAYCCVAPKGLSGKYK